MAREAAFKKRILQDADANVAQLLPAAKKAKAGTANSTAGPVPAPVRIPTTRSTLQGPAGEAMMPRVMPIEWDHVIGKVPIPSSWIVAVDATPDRSMTLGSRCWWVELGQWYKANKKDLTLKSRDWHKRKEALSKPEEPKGDEGLHDWDFVCVEAPTDNEDDEDGPPRRRNRGLWWMFETFKRDPDEFGLLFYDDFAVYGGMEVLENMFDLFAKVCKLSADYRDVWCEVEGLALLLSRTADFSACDDPDKLGQLVELMGHMCLTALRIIKEQGALNTTGTIPNFGFVFSLLIEGVWEMGQCTAVPAAHTSWIYALLDMAEDAGIEIIGTPGYESTLKSIEDDRRDNHSTASKEKWEKSNFQARLKSYKAKHGGHKGPRSTGALGGSHYDITKLTAAERSDYSGENTLLLERLSRAWASRDRSTSLGEIREWGDTDFLNELLNGAEG